MARRSHRASFDLAMTVVALLRLRDDWWRQHPRRAEFLKLGLPRTRGVFRLHHVDDMNGPRWTFEQLE